MPQNINAMKWRAEIFLLICPSWGIDDIFHPGEAKRTDSVITERPDIPAKVG